MTIEEFLIGKTWEDMTHIPYNHIDCYTHDNLFRVRFYSLKNMEVDGIEYYSLGGIIKCIKSYNFIEYNKSLYNELVEFYPEYMI